jgi:hypothetical protein
MGAISRKRHRHVRSHGPSRASKLRRVFCCLERNCFEFPAQAGTGDPDPGARAETRVPKRAGPVGGNEAMSRTPMTERAPWGSHQRRTIKAPRTTIPVCRAAQQLARCGSTDAGGEDFGYFASRESGFRHPPLTHALWRRPCRGMPRATAQMLRRICVAVTEKPISLFPSVLIKCRFTPAWRW